MFTASNAVLLAPLPYERPDEIVMHNERTLQFPSASVTRCNYDDWRTRAKSFSAMAAFRPLVKKIRPALDPVTFAAAPVVLGLAAFVASYVPARRASRISPVAALGR